MKNISIQAKQEIAVVELINKHFWKSKIGPISAFVIPIFLMIMYKIISKNESTIFISGLPSYFAFCILPLCFISLPQILVEFKTSIILRKISNSRITAVKFSIIVIAYNLIAIFLSTLIIILLYAIFLNKDAPEAFGLVNWVELFYALFNVYISSLSLGLLLGILINKINLVQIVGFCILIISVTFSGQFIPLVVLSSSDAIRYISLFSPISYSLNQMNVVLSPNGKDLILTLGVNEGVDLSKQLEYIKNYNFNGLFDVKNSFDIFEYSTTQGIPPKLTKISINQVYKNWQNIMNLIMPYIVSSIMLCVSIWKFKWTSR